MQILQIDLGINYDNLVEPDANKKRLILKQ